MLRSREHRRGLALLDHLALVHHQDPAAQIPDDGQVVRDEHHGDAELAVDAQQQIEHQRLDGDVEPRDDLVGDQQFGHDAQRARDVDPLTTRAGRVHNFGAGKPDRLGGRGASL